MTPARALTRCSIFIAAAFVAAGCGGGGNPPPTITSVTVSCAASSVPEGQTDQCSASVQGTGSFSTSVTWTASAGSIFTSGLFTAPNTTGQVTITATAVADTSKAGSAIVNVTAPPPPTITSVTPACAHSVVELQSVQCWANVQGTGDFSTAVTWQASAGSISSSGAFTAPSTVGTVTVTATSVADTTKSGFEAVMVVLPQTSGFQYGGIHHVSWSANEYNTPAGTASQDALAATGANWSGLLATWYQVPG